MKADRAIETDTAVIANMINPELDNELTLANEFVLEALNAESNNQLDFSIIPQHMKSHWCAGLEAPFALCSERDSECVTQTKNDDQSLASLDPVYNQPNNKESYLATERSYHLVPDICRDQNTAFWDRSSYFPLQTISGVIRVSKTSTQSNISLPNIDSMDLLDSTHTKPSDIPFNIKQEPVDEENRVVFLNLKDQYEQDGGIEDSVLYVFVKPAGCKVSGIKVLLKSLQDDGSAVQGSHAPICLPSEYNQRRGILSVDFSSTSWSLPAPNSKPNCLIDGMTSFWQLVVKVEREDGRSVCHLSKSFQIRRHIGEYEHEKKFQDQLMHNPVPCTNTSLMGFLSNHPYKSSKSEEISDSKPNVCALQCHINTKSQSDPCNNVFDDNTSNGTSYERKNIVLVPGSKLDLAMISSKIQNEKDVVSIQEQSNFTGLLKVMKTNHLQDASRRKANGYRSAEEAFVWACGHCLFSRGKKSTVKSHVSRQVCQKKRRLLLESMAKEDRNVKPKFRRCHTFSGIQSPPMRNYGLKRCKTP